MTNHSTTSITGRPQVTVIMREVWADQVDDYGADCPFCQTLGQVVTATIYIPTTDGEQTVSSACNCCVLTAIADCPGLDPSRDTIVEYLKEEA